jgi:uncharacterized protein
MTKDSLLRQIDPFRFAENGVTLRGHLLISDMERFNASLFTKDGSVDVVVTFGKDEQAIRYVKGEFSTEVSVQCQRCLETFYHPLKGQFKSGLVKNEQKASELPESYDPLMIHEDVLIIKDMIEDELILSMPIVPKHNVDACKVKLPIIVADHAEFEKKANPFRVIENLKKNNSK